MKYLWLAFFVLLFSAPTLEARSEKLCLALGGGGARGIAHLGILQELERNEIKISCITGTSIGALVGALYSAGYSAEELIHMAKSENWQKLLFEDEVERQILDFPQKLHSERYIFDFELGLSASGLQLPSSLSSARRFRQKLKDLLPEDTTPQDFEKLPVSFAAVATDIETGKKTVLKSGSLSEAVLASSAFPGVFSPVEIEGKFLVDGGSTDNLPTEVARELGATYILAVDLNPPLLTREDLKDLISVSDQAVNILMVASSKEGHKANLILQPAVSDVRLFDFDKFEMLIEAGRQSVRPHVSELKKRFPQKLQREKISLSPTRKLKISKIEIHGVNETSLPRLQNRLEVRAGDLFDPQKVKESLNKIYGMGDYESADYTLDRSDENAILNLKLREKSWGSHYLRIGYTWDGEIQGRQDFNAFLNMEFRHLNRWDASWMHEISLGTNLEYRSEFFQPIGKASPFFLSVLGKAGRSDQYFYRDRSRIAEYEVDEVYGGVDLGFYFQRYFEIRSGLRSGMVSFEKEIGENIQENGHSQRLISVSSFRFDQLDSIYFPRKGIYLESKYSHSFDKLWGKADYQLLENQAHFYWPIRHLSLLLNLEFSSSLQSQLSHIESLRMGGFRSLGGYRDEELRGQHRVLGRIGFLYELPLPRNLLFSKSYWGSWWETGAIEEKWTDIKSRQSFRNAGNIAFGFDTPLGAVFLAYGQSGNENRQFYISAGRSFGRVYQSKH